MHCRKIRSQLPALADGVLPAAERDALRRHLDGCAACSAEVARLERLLALPRPAPTHLDSASFIVAVNARIDARERRSVPLLRRPLVLVPGMLGLFAAAIAAWFLVHPPAEPLDDARLAAEMRTELRDLSNENLAWAAHTEAHDPHADPYAALGASDTLVTAALDEAIASSLFADLSEAALVDAGLEYLTVADLQELLPADALESATEHQTFN